MRIISKKMQLKFEKKKIKISNPIAELLRRLIGLTECNEDTELRLKCAYDNNCACVYTTHLRLHTKVIDSRGENLTFNQNSTYLF